MSGSRIPPSAFPYRSRCTVLNSGVVAIGFPDGGGTPWVIHLRSATSAASSSSNTPMLSGWVAPFDTTPNTHWGAVVEVLLEWISGDLDASVDEVVEHFTALFTAAAYAAAAGGQPAAPPP